ncbi:isoleucyl-tRNA synthetase, mitochondrial isoform X2 [Rhodnius prolixus]|uniref:isoleucyl-tRNA synthetase, mitochondrial isoform X2 n=1 Tax=Rhodnius prolixus TaxID=13249 RepID=UPI003D1887DA
MLPTRCHHWKSENKGFVYRDIKPVYWSPAAKSALAEAELEYHSDHRSTAWTVRLEIASTHLPIDQYMKTPESRLYALIWTTTPWTLPANRAIAYNKKLSYALLEFSDLDGVYIVAEQLMARLMKLLNRRASLLATISGDKLEGCTYRHPFGKELLPLLPGEHVTSEVGTGLVHTAPAHGHEDYLLALANNLSFNCFVNERGEYTAEVGDNSLHNKSVLSKDTQKIIRSMLGENVIAEEEVVHSYPYDWRTSKPVIIRASRQWFIKTDAIKEKALMSLEEVKVMPTRSAQLLVNQIENRPYWCISRQRSWGVPIPVLYRKSNPKEYIINSQLMDVYCDAVKTHGPDFWWASDLEDLVPQDITNQLKIDLSDVERGQDILDIWLDSGLSWASVLNGKKADLYLEGNDQCSGWFQSSLLTSVALTGSAPYKCVYIHGFTVDSEGRKMSKSLGNVVDPLEIARDRADKKGGKALGVDVLRWWVAAHGSQHSNVPVSETTLSNSVEALKKLRNTFKFLLGSIQDMPVHYVDRHPSSALSLLDLYLLHKLPSFLSEVYSLYDSYQFNKVCAKIINFISNELSAIYFVYIKDKLYCNQEEDEERRNMQYTMYHILNTLALAAAPITPLLVEELFSHHPHNSEKKPFFQSEIRRIDCTKLTKSKLEVDQTVEKIFEVKEELMRNCPVNVNSSCLWCHLHLDPELHSKLQSCHKGDDTSSILVDILQVSGLSLHLDDSIEGFKLKISATYLHQCPRCWRYNSQLENILCDRCSNVVKKIDLF